ncbi:MAG: SAVED domain-containing protein [Chloroflexi bacterium]|nr:SAVED domain-containing protein [Chloroflexota bacterium]
MSVSHIPDKVKFQLWGQSAGRCQYDGCNKILWRDLVTKARYSTAYIAHIIADKEDGPRGDKVLSKRLKNDISNLILLCDAHHRLVDVEDVSGHSVERLQGMKKKHENRVNMQTSLGVDKESHVLHYGANIGRLNSFITWEKSYEAMLPNKYPANDAAIELSLLNSPFQDNDENYWKLEQENLQRQFSAKIHSRMGMDINHLSVFAIAPQPLLIELGRLLSDTSGIDVYQHQKEPEDNWAWQDTGEDITFEIIPPVRKLCSEIALNLSLSADIDNDRILSVLGGDTCIWTMTIANPNNDFIKTRNQLGAFRKSFRALLNQIQLYHGQNTILKVFPSVPVSVAIEIGRVWMPKADLPLMLYDQNRQRDGFFYTLSID